MSIEDGYFLGSELKDADANDTNAIVQALQAFEDKRKPHTARVSQAAYMVGKMFHRIPPVLRPLRDFVFDHTGLLQKVQGDAVPAHIVKALPDIESVPPAAVG